ncbi:hypothetical protein CYFUS_006584 [Cystobacter fuscus]|uniref:Uncharacterized protein n=1 Tax=Cystobacter fuscus TaxID=43 RepID=A0A250JCB9_9BACT|nr:hypothetical protein [Cystobacter fuscus]ATB41122.1 hypothetical protein CYFUS_006584 [Cystobacter fuscus]
MKYFFTPRQRRLMGLPESEEPEPKVPTGLPERCCTKAVEERCTCEARGWKCPEHGRRLNPCTGLTHD